MDLMLARRSQPEPQPASSDSTRLSDRRAREHGQRLRAMVDEYVDFVARVLRNDGIQSSDVDDLVQGTFITAARRLDDIRPGSEKAFLLRIALNLNSHRRRTLARRREVLSDEMPEPVIPQATPEDHINLNQARELLDRVLDQMDGDLRRVFVLFEFEDMNRTEIAAALGIRPGTVASRLRRARAAFRIFADRVLG
jgi:RNA polymerase sigma-70 factor (ECF subfamily)